MDSKVKAAPGLNDLPDEVLLQLMNNLNDTSLLDMTSVCKRFKRIAKEVFTVKYNGATGKEDYFLKIFSTNLIEEHKLYRPFFTQFGENMNSISIFFHDSNFVAKDHWIIGLIQRYCKSLAKIEISNGKNIDLTGMIVWLPKPTLTHLQLEDCTILNYSWVGFKYPKLIYFCASGMSIATQKLDEFIDNNRQLQELHLLYGSTDINILHSISGKLNDLRTLSITTTESPEFLPGAGTTDLPKLEKFDLDYEISTDIDYKYVLQSIQRGCKNIKELQLDHTNDCIWWNDQLINVVCEFNQLKSLRLCAKHMKINHVKRIIQKIDNLSSLNFLHVRTGEIFDNVLKVISICSKLPKLKSNLEIDFSYTNNNFQLNHDFLTQIAEITKRNAGMTITLDSFGKTREVTSTQGEVRCRDAIVYWSGYDPTHNQTKLTLLDLGNKCMERIISYLDMNAKSALYNTCTQTQKAVKDQVSNVVFHIPALSSTIDEDAFQCLAPSIHRMIIKHDLSLEHWELINRYCTNVIELKIIGKQTYATHGTNISLPNLKNLIFSKWSPIDFKGLRSFDCPLLSYLEVLRFETETSTIESARVLYLCDSYRYLTVLKFGHCNEGVEKFFKGLDESVCNQLKEVSLGSFSSLRESLPGSTNECHMGIIGVIARCRNLKTLRLIIPDIEKVELWFLFENCTKLTDFTVCCSESYRSKQIFKYIEEECKDIKSIQMVIRDSKRQTFQRSFLKEIVELFPDVSLTVTCVDGKLTFPLTKALVKNKPM